MFEKIAKEERQVYWTYGGVMSAAYPLEHLDSIEPSTGRLNPNSALAIVVYGNSAEHLNLLPNLLEQLVHKKWITYGRKVLFGQLATFFVYFVTVFWCFLLRPTPFEQRMNSSDLYCLARLHKVDLSVLSTRTHSGFPAKAIFLVSCVLLLTTFLTRLLCLDAIEDTLWVLIVLLTSVKFLFFCRGFKMVGPFVLMLYKIIMKDLLRFFIIYCIIAIGFSQAFYVIFLGYRRNDPNFNIREEETIMSNVAESFIRMFIMSLTEFTVLFDQLDDCDLAVVGKITFLIYMLLVTMLLINMLIAMMTNTYTEVSANSLEWLRQWSAIILMMEQSFDPKTRLKYQAIYSIPMEDRQRIALLLKLRIPDDEYQENRKLTERKRRKFKEDMRRATRLPSARTDAVVRTMTNK
ncbi:Transient receptor potential cation channel subfamily V member 5 [Toxocara canis]|uniref:Transient receptor potential cation channel subfamily V member 5 n=1 Tax=Toxocara canis TaxID=6265 RepID=A0A0B2VNS4_TOXCA|nr:Transient receptor potential cation channel subfamily V member 5 [Toxocara canis]